MARAVRFTKPEREAILQFAHFYKESATRGNEKGKLKVAESIITKLTESEQPKAKGNYLTVRDAIASFRAVLDRRLIVPPNEAGLEYIRMQQRLQSLALTREQCIAAAEQAGREWKGSIKAQSILNQAERLLANAESEPLPMEGRSDYETRTMSDL